MCWMIYFFVPTSTEDTVMSRLPIGMRAWPASLPEVAYLTTGYSCLIVGNGHCSCDLYLKENINQIHVLRRKYEKQKWTESKIARALTTVRTHGFPGNLNPELRTWLVGMVEHLGVASVFVHWISEKVDASLVVQMKVEELADAAYMIEEEVLYQIVAI